MPSVLVGVGGTERGSAGGEQMMARKPMRLASSLCECRATVPACLEAHSAWFLAVKPSGTPARLARLAVLLVLNLV
jgi:hypothetical protein